MGNPFKKPKIKGLFTSQIAAREQAARQAERNRIAQETAAADAKKQQEAEAALAQKESQRQAFAGQLAATEDEAQRKRFLKGA